MSRGGDELEMTGSVDSSQASVEMTTQQAASEEAASAVLLTFTNNSSGPSTAVVVTSLQVNQGDEDIGDIPLAATELFPGSPAELTPDRRPAFISVTVLKATRGADTGISVEEVEDSLSITNVDSEGLFGETPLCVGDAVLSVNNTSCENKSAAFVSRLIKRSRRSVTLVARRPDGDPYIVSTMVTKPNTTSKVGIGLQVFNGCLCVSSIDPSGLFAGGILNVGDKCVSIGGISCAFMDSTSAIQLIRKENKIVSIVTWTDQEAGVVVAAVSSGRFWIAPWKKLLIFFVLGVIVFFVGGYFANEKNSTAPSSGRPPPCTALNGRPLSYTYCQNVTRI